MARGLLGTGAMHPLSRATEAVGTALGWAAAPLFAAASSARHARTFHPVGIVLSAEVSPAVGDGSAVGRRLCGPALVRFSPALWRHELPLPDALGCSIRFRRSRVASADPQPGDQDLLLATIRRPWTMFFAPFATRVHDYLANRYFGVSPFDVPPLGTVYIRARPLGVQAEGDTRNARLLTAARSGAELILEARRTWTRTWTPIAVLDLGPRVEIDQERMRFSPFRTGRDLVPRGLIHAMRRGAYAASQAARPAEASLRR